MIDWGALFDLIWTGTLSGLALVIVVSVAIREATRAGSERREGNAAAATLHGVLAGVAAAVVAGGVVIGVAVMLHKG